jgi:hypothetical protein
MLSSVEERKSARKPSRQYKEYLDVSKVDADSATSDPLAAMWYRKLGINPFGVRKELAGRQQGFRPANWEPPFKDVNKSWEAGGKKRKRAEYSVGTGMDMVEF